MNNIFSDLFIIQDRTLSSIANDAHLPLSTHLGSAVYAIVNVNNAGACSVDVNKILCRYPGIDLNRTYYDFFTNSCTLAMTIDTAVSIIPQRDPLSQKYLYRMTVIDPNAQSDWTVSFGSVDNPNITNDMNQMGILNDLIITPPEGTILNNLLVSVNGVILSTIVSGSSVYVIDGFSAVKQTGQNDIVVCDTTDIGGHTVIPLSSTTLKSPDTDLPSRIITTLPSSISGTPCALVFDGYLKLFNNSYCFPNDTTLAIKTPLLELTDNFLNHPLQRFREDFFSVRNRPNPYDPTTYTPVLTPKHPTVINDETLDYFNTSPVTDINNLISASFIKTRFNSPHSFLIKFNNQDIYLNKYSLENMKEPHVYECYSTDTPRGMLVYGDGKVLPYTITSNRTDAQHIIYLGAVENSTGLYQTGLNLTTVPSRIADLQDPSIVKPAHLIDIYAATS